LGAQSAQRVPLFCLGGVHLGFMVLFFWGGNFDYANGWVGEKKTILSSIAITLFRVLTSWEGGHCFHYEVVFSWLVKGDWSLGGLELAASLHWLSVFTILTLEKKSRKRGRSGRFTPSLSGEKKKVPRRPTTEALAIGGSHLTITWGPRGSEGVLSIPSFYWAKLCFMGRGCSRAFLSAGGKEGSTSSFLLEKFFNTLGARYTWRGFFALWCALDLTWLLLS